MTPSKTIAAQVKEVMRSSWERGQELRAIAIDSLLDDLDRLESQGKKGGKYWNFIISQLDSLGYDRDFGALDSGNPYETRTQYPD